MGGNVVMPQSLPNEALGDAKGVNQARYHVEMTPESCSAVHPNMVPNAPYSLPQPGSGGRVLICRSMRNTRLAIALRAVHATQQQREMPARSLLPGPVI